MMDRQGSVVTGNFPQVLRPRRWKVLGLLAVSGGFTAGGVWMLAAGEWEGWLVSGFFGLCFIVAAALLLPGSAYLRLGPEGFEVCSLFRARSYRWADVEGFGVALVGGNRMVAFNFAPGFPGSVVARRLAVLLSGWEGALPDTYGMGAEELAALLNGYRQAAAPASPASPAGAQWRETHE
jgi:hypothetical protein